MASLQLQKRQSLTLKGAYRSILRVAELSNEILAFACVLGFIVSWLFDFGTFESRSFLLIFGFLFKIMADIKNIEKRIEEVPPAEAMPA